MTPEGAILKQILDRLAAEHIRAFRMNTGAVASEYKGKNRFMRFGTPGMADILAFPKIAVKCLKCGGGNILAPYPVWIEIKAAKGQQSALQASFQQQVEGDGHVYILARSVDDVLAILRPGGE
jgi:hypothetical protein